MLLFNNFFPHKYGELRDVPSPTPPPISIEVVCLITILVTVFSFVKYFKLELNIATNTMLWRHLCGCKFSLRWQKWNKGNTWQEKKKGRLLDITGFCETVHRCDCRHTLSIYVPASVVVSRKSDARKAPMYRRYRMFASRKLRLSTLRSLKSLRQTVQRWHDKILKGDHEHLRDNTKPFF